MTVFVDTSAFLAVLNANDQFHVPAKKTWIEILLQDDLMISSNYVVLETTILLQHRFGLEAVRLFVNEVLPVVEIFWIDETMHGTAMNALLTANRRNLSLVDCTSFEMIRQKGEETVFSFDPHFQEQGFRVIPK
jgi:predicted nucleic acid-binding protein